MTGFCSCKTGIHAIHGNNLGAAPQASLQYRHRDLHGLRRGSADHCIEDPEVIEKILTHLDAKAAEPEATRRPPCRLSPQRGLFDERDAPTMTCLGL